MYTKQHNLFLIIPFLLFTACQFMGSDGDSDSGGDSELSSDHSITSFVFTSANNGALSSDVTGIISGYDIAVTVPYGTGLTSLTADFSVDGQSLFIGNSSQVSGSTANDFTHPVIYTVSAEDGSFQNYTVYVTAAGSSSKDMLLFSFLSGPNSEISSSVSGTISGSSITIMLNEGTDVTDTKASFITSGTDITVSGVSQESGVSAQDFSGPVVYTVIAADGSSQSYTVTINFVAQ